MATVRYHINPKTMRPNVCRAKTPESCDYYDAENNKEAPHFTNKIKARDYVERVMAEEEGETKTLTKNRDYRVEFGTDWEFKKAGETLAKNVKTGKTVYISENGREYAEEVETIYMAESPIDQFNIRVVRGRKGEYYTLVDMAWDGDIENFDEHYKSLDSLDGPFNKEEARKNLHDSVSYGWGYDRERIDKLFDGEESGV